VSRSRRVRAALVAVSCAAVAAGCSSPSPSATRTPPSSTTTTAAGAAACPSSQVAASVDFTKDGGGSSLAGALLFRNTGSTACALRGVPRVRVVSSGGGAIPTYEAPDFPLRLPTAVLPAGAAPGSSQAGSSITFSSWTCAVGSFSLTVRFAGWTTSVPAPGGAASGSCPPSQEVDQTVYVSPVTKTSG